MQSHAILSAVAAFVFLTAASAAQAAEISVVAPTDNETIFSNQGKLAVELRRTDAPPRAEVRLVLDGKARPITRYRNVIELDGIDRGSHRLQAVLVNADGERIAVSRLVSFYLWHASRLFPNRK